MSKQTDIYPVFDILDRLYREGHKVIRSDVNGYFLL